MKEGFALQPLEKQPENETKKKRAVQEAIKGAENLPQSVQDIIAAFPARLRCRLFPKSGADEMTFESEEQALEAMLETFDHETRERFLGSCLSELFKRTDIRHTFQECYGTPDTDLKKGIVQLMETLWQNRGKKSDDMKLFHQEFNDTLLKERRELEKDVEEKEGLLATFRKQVPRHGVRGRLSKRNEERDGALRGALRDASKKLQAFDERHNNTSYHQIYGRDFTSRMFSEWIWTHRVVRATEYYEPTEFATSMLEQLEAVPFSAERRALRDRVSFGYPISRERLKEAKEILETVSEAVDVWYKSHEHEEAFKKTVPSKKEEREATLIEYFNALRGSYVREKKHGASEDNLENTARQMENTLRVLKNIFEEA